MERCAKYERKISPYLPLFPQEYLALHSQLENIRVLVSFIFTQWVKEKVVEFIQLSHLSHVKIEVDKTAVPMRNLIVINKIDFLAKNLTSNAGLFLLLEYAKANGIFELIDTDLVFDNEFTNNIKMNHIKTMLCGHFIGIDKLERLKLLQGDPLVNEFEISVDEGKWRRFYFEAVFRWNILPKYFAN